MKRLMFLILTLLLAVTFIGCGDAATTGEGTVANPVVLTTYTPYDGFVDNDFSYYKVQIDSINYVIEISGMTDNVDVEVFSDADFITLIDDSNNPGTADEYAYFGSPATYYIKISGANAASGGAVYNIHIFET